jgi:uracil phosphoribosyltransferase
VKRVPLHIVDHPLVHDALVKLRDKAVMPELFRQAATRISLLLVAEALRDLPTEPLRVQTPLATADGRRVGCDVVVVPVLRAGLGMLEAVLALVPSARVGHIGLQRDESTAIASQYYSKLPARLDQSYVVMVDPMLATGGSAGAPRALRQPAGARELNALKYIVPGLGDFGDRLYGTV